MKHTLDFFSYQSSMYDEYQAHCIPKYPELTCVAGNFLAHALAGTEPVSILDLGCGTGNTTRQVREVLPAAQITCLDGSEDMLARARAKLSVEGTADPSYCRGDLTDPKWAYSFREYTFDAVISVLVLEHLPFEAYRHCIAQVLRILKPGGWFVTAEGYGGDLLQGLFMKEMKQQEEQFVRDGHMTRAQMDEMKALSAATEKHYFSSMHERETWWIEAGYSSVAFIWQYYSVALLVGQKPTS